MSSTNNRSPLPSDSARELLLAEALGGIGRLEQANERLAAQLLGLEMQIQTLPLHEWHSKLDEKVSELASLDVKATHDERMQRLVRSYLEAFDREIDHRLNLRVERFFNRYLAAAFVMVFCLGFLSAMALNLGRHA